MHQPIHHRIRYRIQRHTISFKHAFDGLFWALRSQPNYLVHVTLSVLSIVFGLIYQIRPYEWLTLFLLIVVGLAFETINSSIEQVMNCVSLEVREDIRIAKDAAAAAMLIVAIGATCIACYIFVPYIFRI